MWCLCINHRWLRRGRKEESRVRKGRTCLTTPCLQHCRSDRSMGSRTRQPGGRPWRSSGWRAFMSTAGHSICDMYSCLRSASGSKLSFLRPAFSHPYYTAPAGGVWAMSDPSAKVLSLNPNAPQVAYPVYSTEKAIFVAGFVGAILYGTMKSLHQSCSTYPFNPPI